MFLNVQNPSAIGRAIKCKIRYVSYVLKWWENSHFGTDRQTNVALNKNLKVFKVAPF
jgi:hypothetical protein